MEHWREHNDTPWVSMQISLPMHIAMHRRHMSITTSQINGNWTLCLKASPSQQQKETKLRITGPVQEESRGTVTASSWCAYSGLILGLRSAN